MREPWPRIVVCRIRIRGKCVDFPTPEKGTEWGARAVPSDGLKRDDSYTASFCRAFLNFHAVSVFRNSIIQIRKRFYLEI